MSIVWSQRAKEEIERIAKYLAYNFGNSSVEKLICDTQLWTNRLLQHPNLGAPEPLLRDKSIPYRSLIFTPHNKLIYYVKGDTIRIVDIWDMRRNPEVLFKRIRTK